MRRFSLIIAVIILFVSLFLLFDKLFTPQPIQIVLQSGQEVTTQTSDYFTLTETILLIVCSFLIGTTATYLFYNSDSVTLLRQPKEGGRYDAVLPLLREDEKKVVIALRDSKGEMLQNRLVLKLNLPKVKMSRVLTSLERKRLVVKERSGLTNKIRLVD